MVTNAEISDEHLKGKARDNSSIDFDGAAADNFLRFALFDLTLCCDKSIQSHINTNQTHKVHRNNMAKSMQIFILL